MKKLATLLALATLAFNAPAKARDATAQECLNEINKNKQAEEKQHRYFERFQELKTVEARCEYFAEGIAYFKQLKKTAQDCRKHEPEQASSLHEMAVEQLNRLTPELKKCSAQVTVERQCSAALDKVHPLQERSDEKLKLFNREFANKEDKTRAGCEMLKAGIAYYTEFGKASRTCEPLDPQRAQRAYETTKEMIAKLRDGLDQYCKSRPSRQQGP